MTPAKNNNELPSSPPVEVVEEARPADAWPPNNVDRREAFTLMTVLLIILLMATTAAVTYYRTATITRCHDDKFLWVKVGETCVTEKRY